LKNSKILHQFCIESKNQISENQIKIINDLERDIIMCCTKFRRTAKLEKEQSLLECAFSIFLNEPECKNQCSEARIKFIDGLERYVTNQCANYRQAAKLEKEIGHCCIPSLLDTDTGILIYCELSNRLQFLLSFLGF
jgi:hypothetical protein